jgi:hypothetical protein
VVLLVEGTGDGIVDLEYGRRYAESIPNCCFEVISEAEHFPHIEKLDEVLGSIRAFEGVDGKLARSAPQYLGPNVGPICPNTSVSSTGRCNTI